MVRDLKKKIHYSLTHWDEAEAQLKLTFNFGSKFYTEKQGTTREQCVAYF